MNLRDPLALSFLLQLCALFVVVGHLWGGSLGGLELSGVEKPTEGHGQNPPYIPVPQADLGWSRTTIDASSDNGHRHPLINWASATGRKQWNKLTVSFCRTE